MLLLYVCLIWFSSEVAADYQGTWWNCWGENQGLLLIGSNSSPQTDADKLYNAMKGFGTDEDTIIKVVTDATNRQRQEICQAYSAKYKRDLLKDLQDETSGDFSNVIIGLLLSPAHFYAKELHDAIKGTDRTALIEIFSTLRTEELQEVANIYEQEYSTTLENDIKDHTSGYVQITLKHLFQGDRGDPSTDVNDTLVKMDVQALCTAVNKLNWADEEKIKILTQRKGVNLLEVFKKYPECSGESIETTIKRKTTELTQQIMLALVRSTQNIFRYFTECLYIATKKLGTDEQTLSRILITRREKDLPYIIREYENKYVTSFYGMVEDETSGDYRKTVLKLIEK